MSALNSFVIYIEGDISSFTDKDSVSFHRVGNDLVCKK